MKEISIEDKARLYDEALKEAAISHKDEDKHLKATLERIFPALKESEDERIRKAIIEFVKYKAQESLKDKWIAFLEKQGESDETKAKIFLTNKGYPIDANGKFPAYKEMYDIIKEGLEKQREKTEPIEGFNTEFERQISHIIANTINKEYEYTEDSVKRVSNALLNYAKHEFEKQGEQKPTTDFSDIRTWKYIVDAVWTEIEGIGQYLDRPFTEEVAKKLQKRFGNIEQKPTEQVEPKFKIGDWVVDKVIGSVYQIKDCIENTSNHKYGYDLTNGGYIGSAGANHFRLWTIEDAKDGDVLACGNDIVIFKENNYNPEDKSGCMFVHCSLQNNRGYWYTIGSINPTFYKPATKEQRDQLEKAMTDAGYEWDAEKKELREIK